MKRIGTMVRETFSGFTANDYLILLFVAASSLSVFIMAGMMLLLPFYILASGQWKKALPKRMSDYFLLIFAALALITTVLNSKDGLVNGFELKKEYLLLLGIGIIILAFDIFFFLHIINRRVFILGLKLVTAMSIITFLVALYQVIFKIYPDPIDRPGRVASLYINENYYGMALEFVILIALFLLFSATERKKKMFYGSVIFINVVALWFCKTRAAYVVVAVAIFLFFFVYKRKVSYSILIVIATVALVLIKYPSILPRFDTISSYLDFRLGIWECALNSFKKFPLLGRGYFSYSTIWLEGLGETAYQALHAHNLYIEMLINFGIVGTLPLICYCFSRISDCIKVCFKQKSTLSLALIVSACSAVLIHGLADTTIFWPQTGFFAVYLLASENAYKED